MPPHGVRGRNGRSGRALDSVLNERFAVPAADRATRLAVAAEDRPWGAIRRDGDAGRRARLHGAMEERLPGRSPKRRRGCAACGPACGPSSSGVCWVSYASVAASGTSPPSRWAPSVLRRGPLFRHHLIRVRSLRVGTDHLWRKQMRTEVERPSPDRSTASQVLRCLRRGAEGSHDQRRKQLGGVGSARSAWPADGGMATAGEASRELVITARGQTRENHRQ